MKKSTLMVSLVGCLFLVACGATGADQASADLVKVWIVDTSGKPPFKRFLLEVPAEDLARLETTTGEVETQSMRVVDFRGSPPFRRSIEDIPVIDAANIEIKDSGKVRRTVRPKPFLKRHR